MVLVKLAEGAPNSFGFTCCSCHKFRDSGKDGGYADLDGPAFRTFYCKGCGDAYTRSVQGMRESPPAEKDS